MTTDASWTDSMPEIYDSTLGPTLFEPYGPLLASTVAEGNPERVLELAAGTGIATAHLVRQLAPGTVTATDLNPAMVAWARERVPGADWQVADAQQLTFADASFDAVACQFGAMFFPDRVGAFAEVARVLRPGGAFVATVWDVVERSPLTHAMVQSLEAVLGPDAPGFIVRVPHGYHDPDRIAADLRDGGLTPVSVAGVSLRGSAPDAATLARGFALGSPLRFGLAELGRVDELSAQLAEELTRRLGDGPLEGELGAWLVRAVRD